MIFGFKLVFKYDDEYYSLNLTYSEYYSAPSDFWDKADIINFLIVGLVLFFIVRRFSRYLKFMEAAAPPTATETLLAEIRDLLAQQPRIWTKTPRCYLFIGNVISRLTNEFSAPSNLT